MLVLLTVICALQWSALAGTFHWVSLKDYPTAVCNDESPAGYYFYEGASTSKWIIYLEGGGFCYDKTSCDNRWKLSPSLMSSKAYGSTIGGSGILSSNATINEYWHDATMVLVKYCTSDSWSGNNKKSVLGWSFMGSNVVDATIDSLLKTKGLDKATKVLFTGTSAGAEGLYPNSDRVASMLGPKVDFKVLIDSGWFMDFAPFRPLNCDNLWSCTEQGGLMRGVPHWEPRLNEGCAKSKVPDDHWQCMMGYHAFPYVKAKCLVMQYRFDAAQMGHDGLGLPKTPAEIKYAQDAIKNLTKTFQETTPTGIFSPSCYFHGVLTLNHWYLLKIRGMNIGQVFDQWSKNPSGSGHVYTDDCILPNCNPTCRVL